MYNYPGLGAYTFVTSGKVGTLYIFKILIVEQSAYIYIRTALYHPQTLGIVTTGFVVRLNQGLDTK